ncbi:MAG: DUF4367 domain-containing protein [Defluviitaleaceae bacterium]|nr:DUF4367 domain-containing protein [Defluviitaleaceae bacterium]
MKNDDFLAMCKSIDPSAEIDREKNLAEIKNRLSIDEERIIMMKKRKFRKPAIAVAVLIGLLSLSAATYAAVVWRDLDTRIIQGEEYVNSFTVQESSDGSYQVWGMEIDPNATSPIIAEVDGEQIVLLDTHDYDDLNTALARLSATIGNVMIPAYIPNGFVFDNATYHANVSSLDIRYSFGELGFRMSIMLYPEEWGIPMWSGTFEDIEINGLNGRYGEGMLWLQVGDIAYTFDGYHADLSLDQLIQIAESLQ